MRLIRFIDPDGQTRYGHDPDPDYTSAALIDNSPLHGGQATDQRVPIQKLLCPLEPRAIFGIGLNYRAHAEETGAAIPDWPVLFFKNPASINHPDDPIVLPRCSIGPEVDYEVELAVVIGSPARDVPEDQALDHVLGYTVANDVSARRWQKHSGGGQWNRGKSFDTFCPFGPCIVTKDEIPDPQNLNLTTTLNDQTMQAGNTADMIFSVAQLIAELSRDLTILPGTLILTGTPPGVGVARDPKVFLHPNDTVTCAIDPIGSITNPVTQHP